MQWTGFKTFRLLMHFKCEYISVHRHHKSQFLHMHTRGIFEVCSAHQRFPYIPQSLAICKYCYSPNKFSGFSTPFPSQTHRSSDRDLLGRECDAAVLLLLLIVRRGKNIRNIYKHQYILVCTISSKSSGGEYFHPVLSSHTFLFHFLVTPKGV